MQHIHIVVVVVVVAVVAKSNPMYRREILIPVVVADVPQSE
jgi:hypothetical protein